MGSQAQGCSSFSRLSELADIIYIMSACKWISVGRNLSVDTGISTENVSHRPLSGSYLN